MTGNSTTLRLIGIVSVISLLICIGSSIAVFYGAMSVDAFKDIFLAASIAWFATATILSKRWDRSEATDDASI